MAAASFFPQLKRSSSNVANRNDQAINPIQPNINSNTNSFELSNSNSRESSIKNITTPFKRRVHDIVPSIHSRHDVLFRVAKNGRVGSVAPAATSLLARGASFLGPRAGSLLSPPGNKTLYVGLAPRSAPEPPSTWGAGGPADEAGAEGPIDPLLFGTVRRVRCRSALARVNRRQSRRTARAHKRLCAR